MKRLAVGWILCGLAACGDVPSVRVTATVRAAEVAKLGVLVVREGRAAAVIDCVIDAQGAQTGRCPFEEARTTWTPADPLSFVLYGEPGVSLDVRFEGLDARGVVVTSTRATVSIPETGTAERELMLAARTEVQARCALDIDQGPGSVPATHRERSAVLPLDIDGDGLLEVVVATPRRLALLSWTRSPGGQCTLTQTATISTNCWPRPGTLIGGEFDLAQDGPEVAAMCLEHGSFRYHLEAWTLGPRGEITERATMLLPYSVNQTTRTMAADLDGDGQHELSLLAVTSTTGPAVSVLSWRVSDDRVRTTRIGGVRLTSTSIASIAPVAVAGDGDIGDALVIGGHRGGLYFLDGDGVHIVDANTQSPPAALSGAVYQPRGARPRALFVRGGSPTTLFDAAIETGVRPSVRPFADGQVGANQVDVAVAVGDVDGNGESSAVVAFDGFVQVFPLTSTSALARRFPVGEVVNGAMVVLLADIDAHPGAEILAFSGMAGRVYALNGAGAPIVGFPLDLGVPGTDTRIMVADLDRDGALELVSVSFNRVSVASLGRGTYHLGATPWPEPFHDARGSGLSRDQRDPRVP